MKKISLFALLLSGVVIFSSCGFLSAGGDVRIHLSDEEITVNGKEVSTDEKDGVYQKNDIVYYPEGKDFTFGEGTKEDEHSVDEADAHKVIHISKAGNYILSGKLSKGQIAVDLGENAENDPEAIVNLTLDGVDISCSVAPAVIFYNVYECGTKDEEKATKDVDTSAAGANVYIADGTKNTVSGSYVAKIYKSYEFDETLTEIVDSKKLHKYDGAFYSKRTLNIYGGKKNSGVLDIAAENEGISSEMHLMIHGGNINIVSGNDGINANEDGISVVGIKGGKLNITIDGSTGEGDGIDSNGWIVVDGGEVSAYACGFSMDSGIDADMGIHINGGTVVATGNMLDAIDDGQNYAVFSFDKKPKGGVSEYVLKDISGKEIVKFAPPNDFSQLVISDSKLAEGEYKLYCDGVALNGSKINSGLFMQPKTAGGEPPEFFDREPPKFSGGGKPPRFEGAPKDFPEDERMKFPDGEFPEEWKNTPLESRNDVFKPVETESASEILVITNGANFFYVE